MEFYSDTIIASLAIIGVFFIPIPTVAGIIFFWLKTRNKERMELIKQGLIPSERAKSSPNKYTSLRNGCLFSGTAIGIIVGLISDYLLNFEKLNSLLIIISSTVLFIGIAYIIFFLLVKDKDLNDDIEQ
ncbi:MAG: DUF6249 domain-containing protein [Dysgonomonas sp.]